MIFKRWYKYDLNDTSIASPKMALDQLMLMQNGKDPIKARSAKRLYEDYGNAMKRLPYVHSMAANKLSYNMEQKQSSIDSAGLRRGSTVL
jgi:hypothetical protein